MIVTLLLAILTLLGIGYWYLIRNKNFWHERGILNTGFKFFWGDTRGFLFQTEAIHAIELRQYKRFSGAPFYGSWGLLGKVYLNIRNDFDLIRAIWIKDFDHFGMAHGGVSLNRTIWPATREEKLMLTHVQNATGDDWKDIRYQRVAKCVPRM